MSSYQIELRGLQAEGIHGVFGFEQQAPQPFSVDVTVHLDTTEEIPDRLEATVDFNDIALISTSVIRNQSYQLVETIADQIAGQICALGPVRAVEVTVHKLAAPLQESFSDVAVRVHRQATHPAQRVVYSLGSNQGDRLGWLQFGVTALATAPGVKPLALSSVYESAPVGVDHSDNYLNLVLVLESDQASPYLLRRGQELESLAGRRPVRSRDLMDSQTSLSSAQNGELVSGEGGSLDSGMPASGWNPADHPPRTLDIDLICVGDEVNSEAYLTLPHPRAAGRAFVLVPWLEADPAAHLAGRPLADYLPAVAGQEIHRRDDLNLVFPLPSP